MTEVSGADRERYRDKLSELADEIRKEQKMTVPEVRRYLRQLLDVSI